MSLDTIFLLNLSVMLAWALPVFAPRWKGRQGGALAS
jgi:hypothetical protein